MASLTMARRVAFRYRMAREFPSDKARKDYLQEHPGADPSKHTVSEEKAEKKPEEKRSLKDRLKAIIKKVPEAAKKFVEDEGYRREQLQGAAKAMEKAPARVVQKSSSTSRKTRRSSRTRLQGSRQPYPVGRCPRNRRRPSSP